MYTLNKINGKSWPGIFIVERCHSAAEQGEKWVDGKVRDIVQIEPETRVRLLRTHSLRMNQQLLRNVNRPPKLQMVRAT